MGFRYDFDMVPVLPDGAGQEIRDLFSSAGLSLSVGDEVALFRDPALVAALRSADGAIQKLFMQAGFGVQSHESPAPENCYPDHDEDARNACLRNLADGIAASTGLNEANWGGFSIDDFMDYLVRAKPLPVADLPAQAAQKPDSSKKKRLARLGLVAGGAFVAASTVGYALVAIG